MSDNLLPRTSIGKLAVDIYDQEFGFEEYGEARNTEVGLISGWLEGHLGELNNLIYTNFSGTNPINFNLEEQAILREMYIAEYNRKANRKVLRGIDGSSGEADFQVIREGDSMIQKSNKNITAKIYHDAYVHSQERIKDMVSSYNIYGAKPNQVISNQINTGDANFISSYYL